MVDDDMTAEEYADQSDIVTRYIYTKRYYSQNGAKHGAFTPPTSYPNEISVDKINNPNISDEEIWALGQEARTDKTLYARADINVSDIMILSDEQGGYLKVLIDGIPHPRHANIKDIPVVESLRKAVTAELANASRLVEK